MVRMGLKEGAIDLHGGSPCSDRFHGCRDGNVGVSLAEIAGLGSMLTQGSQDIVMIAGVSLVCYDRA